VPYFDPEDDDVPRSREIVQNPIITQSSLPMGVRVPEEPRAAIEFLQQELAPGIAEGARREVNRWRALQKLYRHCGWGSVHFDGVAFEQQRADWIQEWNHWKEQGLDFMNPGSQHTKEQKREFERQWNLFLITSAGEDHV
jgi:hypothetical protein